MSERRQITLPLNKVQAPIFDAQFSDYLKLFPHNAPYGTKGFVLNALSYFTENKFGTAKLFTPETNNDAFSVLKKENETLRAELENFENLKLSPLKTELDALQQKFTESENYLSTADDVKKEIFTRLETALSENEHLYKQISLLENFSLIADKSHAHYHNHIALLEVIKKRIAEGKEDCNIEVVLAFYLVAYQHLSDRDRKKEFLTEIKVLA